MTPLHADFSGIGVSVTGLPDRLRADLATTWSGFLSETLAEPALVVDVHADPPSDREHPFAPKSMRAEREHDRVAFRIEQGDARVARSGPIAIRLASTTPALQAAALVNLATAAIAWRLPARESALLHAAGIVIEGRAFVLVGGAGAGKTTWAQGARAAGADVLGDDLVLVDRSAGAWQALASPFRAQASTLRFPGRWPIAALLGAVHAGVASLDDEPAIRMHARLAANLPFAVDGLGADEALDRLLDALVRDVPHRTLSFTPDASFVVVLRAAFP